MADRQTTTDTLAGFCKRCGVNPSMSGEPDDLCRFCYVDDRFESCEFCHGEGCTFECEDECG